ncbi:MAG: hypothetical protein PHS06_04860 [Candidatus Shapirobacteria bacterium]|nr:hypothetical protein [Candidatus Shapirobacteria bacterium]
MEIGELPISEIQKNPNSVEINYLTRTENSIELVEGMEISSNKFGGCEGLFITDGEKFIGAHYPNLNSDANGSEIMNCFIREKITGLSGSDLKVIFLHAEGNSSSAEAYKKLITEKSGKFVSDFRNLDYKRKGEGLTEIKMNVDGGKMKYFVKNAIREVHQGVVAIKK